ncbi:tetratricopeptide repeat protein [Streptomyces bluensis]|uniref:tetratricopeptide repeat protein n=1 Tax=Streptomyces bluensis TaxID=33897 RepID=UPI0036A258B7
MQQDAHATDDARIYQAGGDIIIHEGDALQRRRLAAQATGQPISEVTNPYTLSVKQAITASPSTGGENLPELPLYIERDHDQRLRDVTQHAAAGASGIAILVGGSSTGKTRACWEAIQSLPNHWRLWHPVDPSGLQEILSVADAIQPHTVVWLDEIQHYLLTTTSSLGEQVASKLRTLLRDPKRAPILVLGTIWNEYWITLTTSPTSGKADPHAQARALMMGKDVPVPEVFGERALDTLRATVKTDPRLKLAAENAEQGHITQYLAAAPALMERYRNAPPAAKAVIDAAMDARRLGHSLALPLTFLEAAAPGYLTDLQWDQSADDWLQQALKYAAIPLNGARGPLSRMRPRPGEARFNEPHYRLADFLEQDARTARKFKAPPSTFWDAAALHVNNPDDLTSLASAAQKRLRLQHSVRLYLKAADMGDLNALVQLAGFLEKAGNREGSEEILMHVAASGNTDPLVNLARAAEGEESIRLYQLAIELGDPQALVELCLVREESGDHDGAEQLISQAVNTGNTDALIALAEQRDFSGDDQVGAKRLYEYAIAAGDIDAMVALAEMLDEIGDFESAERAFQQAADSGSTYAVRCLALAAKEAGDLAEAERLYQNAVNAGDIDAFDGLARIREESGQCEAAENLAHRAAEAGNPYVLGNLADMREESGQHKEAELLALRAIRYGNTNALRDLVDNRDDDGKYEDAERLAWLGVKAGSTDALFHLANSRGEDDDWESVERISVRAAEAGITGAFNLRSLALMREHAGDLESAERIALAAAKAGDTSHLTEIALLRDREESRRLFQLAVDAGDVGALFNLAWMCVDDGDFAEAERLAFQAADAGDPFALQHLAGERSYEPRWQKLLKHGLEADGRVCEPWVPPSPTVTQPGQ